MADEKIDATPDSSSALGAAIASSPEALEQPTQETQTPAKEEATQEQAEQQAEEEARVPYSRLKEVVDEKNWYKTQLEQRLAQQSQQQLQQPTQDPYAGMTPEEEKFMRMMDARAEKIAETKIRQISPVIDAGRMELAQMKVQQFRASHSDIKPNSPEEIAIAEKIQMGYLPEDAYKTVMWDKRVADAEKQGNINIKQKIEAKKQANVEQRSIPQGATPPTKEKLTLRQRIEKSAENMEF
jgi:hypothetical protein